MRHNHNHRPPHGHVNTPHDTTPPRRNSAPVEMSERDEHGAASAQEYSYSRVVEIAGHIVRARVIRDHYPQQCLAAAEVLADDMTWTRIAENAPNNWVHDTPRPSSTVALHAATELGAVAEELLCRAAAILTPPPSASPSPPAHRHAALADRAIRAAHAHRIADPAVWARRHRDPDQWAQWTRRARVARTLAAALHMPVTCVTVTDDPDRTYPKRTGDVPGDLITVTDPTTGRAWRFILDFAHPGEGWLLLENCPSCTALIPTTRIATLADLGEHLDHHGESRPTAEESHTDPAHRPGCTWSALPTFTPSPNSPTEANRCHDHHR
jgi:hypothetical protein